jgi:transcriptional regulator with XRE-family HTH domain
MERYKTRTEIAQKIRALRLARHWTQAQLSKKLGLSQGRFSEIERGQGSFTAEQFLEVLKLFNVQVSHFAVAHEGSGAALQNALARLGAAHLDEIPDVLPSERLEEAADVVREALLGVESASHITSLAPVLVRTIDRINLNRLQAQFLEFGLERRWAWLLENTLVAIRQELSGGLPRPEARSHRRAELILSAYLGKAPSNRFRSNAGEALDLLDTRILSEQALEEVQNAASPISRRWGIATALQPADFIAALKASRAAGPGAPEPPGPQLDKAPARRAPAARPLTHRTAQSDPPPPGHGGHGSSHQIEMDWD